MLLLSILQQSWKLGPGFDNPPIQLAGLLIHHVDETSHTKFYKGGAVVGVTPYTFLAAGCYGQSQESSFQIFFTYCRLTGSLMTIGFAEISGVTGGFGYNSSIPFPDVTTVVKFRLSRLRTPITRPCWILSTRFSMEQQLNMYGSATPGQKRSALSNSDHSCMTSSETLGGHKGLRGRFCS